MSKPNEPCSVNMSGSSGRTSDARRTSLHWRPDGRSTGIRPLRRSHVFTTATVDAFRPVARARTSRWASVRECHPKNRLCPPCDGAPWRPGRGASSIRSGRWRGSEAVTTHDLAKLFDVRRALAGEHVGDILEIARAHQTWTDDGKEAGVNIAAVTESMDHAARYEERLARFQVGAPPADGKRSHAVQPKNGFVELVVAVRRGHARIRWNLALEHADTSSGLVRVDVKTDGESPDLDRLGSGVRHGVMIPSLTVR